jgi:SAM-dependent methyltransferase
MSFPDHFSAIAARYATFRPTYPAALVDALASLAAPGTAWDIGCGNGQLAVALASKFTRVIATDPSQAQLDAAIRNPRVEYQCSPAESSGLPDASVDLAVAAQAAHWFDWPRFVDEVGRVAKPGALIALVSYGNLDLDGTVGEAVERYRYVVEPYWPPERVHVDNGYQDLVLPWPAVRAPAIDMTAQWSRDELLGYIQTWSATARLVESEGMDAVDALRADVTAAWQPDDVRTIRWPLAIRLARR